MERFGAALRRLRARDGISIKRLAPALGVNYSYVSKLESGSARPSEELVQRVARYFNVAPDPLLLAADRVPDDVLRILQEEPEEAVATLRDWFRRRES